MADKVQAIRLKQWLPEWDHFDFDEGHYRRKPDPYVLLFSMPAVQLRALSGVYRRTRNRQGVEGLQRLHDPKRSATIRDFIHYGHPYSSLPLPARNNQSAALRKPGWLPTAIVVNILTANDARRERLVAPEDLVKVELDGETRAQLTLPYTDRLQQWAPKALEPFEVIDGQHRLWAFDEAFVEEDLPGNFELPVVAFTGLDIGWQAYLFWSINVSPKRINPSHAFDLFPLLRSAEWLETLSDLRIYRQARAQELTELLFTQAESPFYNRINMLGESIKTAPRGAGVTQAGWVQAITTSLLSTGSGRSGSGLFAAAITPIQGPLDWSRPQQAAFLIALWDGIRREVLEGDHQWVRDLIQADGQQSLEGAAELAFTGPRTMLNQEQGVRGVVSVANEVFFLLARQNPALFILESQLLAGVATTAEDVSIALSELRHSQLQTAINEFAAGVSSFDWRSSDAPNLDDQTRLVKRAFRGSGGYVELRRQLIGLLARGTGLIAEIAAACARL